MKDDIHPKYGAAVIRCACGNVIETRSTHQGTLPRRDEENRLHVPTLRPSPPLDANQHGYRQPEAGSDYSGLTRQGC